MCFSAEASFIVGTVLSVVGIVGIKKSSSLSQVVFASIPLIFAVQQITEGFLWLALLNLNFAFLQEVTTYTFLIFAQVIWPVWVPFSILLLEKDKKRQKIIYGLLGIGILVAAYLAFRLFTHNVQAEIIEHHISYSIGIPVSVVNSLGILYFIATVIPPFISGIKKMWSLGFAIFVSYIVSKLFFENYVISVWCSFAAIISVSVLLIILDFRKPALKEKIAIKPVMLE